MREKMRHLNSDNGDGSQNISSPGHSAQMEMSYTSVQVEIQFNLESNKSKTFSLISGWSKWKCSYQWTNIYPKWSWRRN